MVEKVIKAIKEGVFFQKLFRKLYCVFVVFIVKRVVLLFPIQKNKIIFSNFSGRGFGDSPACIAKELLKSSENYDIVWVVNNADEKLPPKVRAVKYMSVKCFYEFATAKVWVDNVRSTCRPAKRDSQFYLQTYHGEGVVKFVEKDVEEKLSPQYVKSAKLDGAICNAIIAGNQIIYNMMLTSFWLNPQTEILRIGLPCNDFFFDKAYCKAVRDKLITQFGVKDGECIVLYAPTFRDNNATDCYITEFDRLAAAFEKRENKKCRIFVRFHPNMHEYSKSLDLGENVTDVTEYPEIHDLFFISDYMISDYSSVAVGFSEFIRKPVFLYTPDLEDYEKQRGLHHAYFSYPFLRASSFDSLLKTIAEFDSAEYHKKESDFFQNNVMYDNGNASKKAAALIKNQLTGNSNTQVKRQTKM